MFGVSSISWISRGVRKGPNKLVARGVGAGVSKVIGASVGRQRGSIPEHPPGDAHVPLIPAVPGKRLLVPEPVRSRAVGQLDQQCCADIVRTIRRADWPAEDEAVVIRREV